MNFIFSLANYSVPDKQKKRFDQKGHHLYVQINPEISKTPFFVLLSESHFINTIIMNGISIAWFSVIYYTWRHTLHWVKYGVLNFNTLIFVFYKTRVVNDFQIVHQSLNNVAWWNLHIIPYHSFATIMLKPLVWECSSKLSQLSTDQIFAFWYFPLKIYQRYR